MKNSHEIIDRLSPEDALVVLRILASDDEQIAARIAEIALVHLSHVKWEEVAHELYEELEFLEVEEVWDRAGSTREGYVEPSEAAEEMVGEVVEPYLEELKKLGALGMSAEANQMCKGLLFGLYRFGHKSTSEFKNWASDAPSGIAGTVVEVWSMGDPSQADIAALRVFAEDELRDWKANLLRM